MLEKRPIYEWFVFIWLMRVWANVSLETLKIHLYVFSMAMIWYSHRAENPWYYSQSNVIFINFLAFFWNFVFPLFETADIHFRRTIFIFCVIINIIHVEKNSRIILMIKWFEWNNNRVDLFLSNVCVLAWSSRNPITPSFLWIDITHFEIIRITMIS